MREKILALLQAKFAGARKDGLNHIASIIAWQLDTEEKANEVVGKLTADQVNSFIADWRREADAEITKANRTYEDGLKKKYDFTEKKTEPATPTLPEPVSAGNVDAAAIQKLIADSISAATKPLLEQLSTLKAGETAKTRLQSLNEKLNDCKDEKLKAKALKDFARMRFDTDEAFQEYLTETEADVKAVNQAAAETGLGEQGRPMVPNTPTAGKEATKEEIDAVMDKLPI
jgi:hypothetical protein